MSIPDVPKTPAPRRRRRGQSNPLLPRIIGVAVLIHLIGLPILAHFGAFKKVQQQFLETKLVTLPPPEKPKAEPKTEKKAQPKVVRHPESKAIHSHAPASTRSALAQPKVVAAAGSPGAGGDGGPTVDPNGTGVAGQLPGNATTPAPASTPTPAPDADPSTPLPMVPSLTPEPTLTPRPVPTPTPVPKLPTFTEATPIDEIKPVIPDALRSDALDATMVIAFTVGADGVPTSVRIAESSSTPELNDLGLKTARQWRFKPATRDGEPVESIVRLHIEFQVN